MHATTTGRGARTVGAVGAALVAVALLGACGDPATGSKATSLADVLGMDESSFQEREARVQEAVRTCMKEQGFDYVPMDPSQMNVRMVGPGMEDDAEFRRTQGYGITTGFKDVGSEVERRGDDPNQKIREALSESDREAYDKALFGAAAGKVGANGEVSISIGPGPGGGGKGGPDVAEAPEQADMGCFGKAQSEAGDLDRVRELGPKLEELRQRIESDPRIVKANTAWSRCMAAAGYDFETPEDVVPWLFEKLDALRGDDGDDGDAVVGAGGITVGGAGPVPDSPELEALRAEELAIAKADDACSKSTGRRDVARKVREEQERRFLEENPDLGSDRASGGGEG